MCSTNNGFRIAEADLEQRGPGDFFTNRQGDARQSGGMKFRFATLCDMELLQKAFSEATDILQNDPALKTEENKNVSSYMDKLFGRLQNS
jgi:ATP-dependent DNA helicase RecG